MVRTVLPALALCLLASVAIAQSDPSGIDFVTVGSPNNAPWTGGGSANGRGEVDYSYRIGKYEVAHRAVPVAGGFLERCTQLTDRQITSILLMVFAPTAWGAASTTPVNPGGQHFTVPAGNAMLPTGGVDWRTCAIFCNWLCNGESTSRSAFLNGAYDVSTFGYVNGGDRFTDQITHNPGAPYYIPSLDEWMKAAHYDPNKNGTGQGGWWLYSNSSDSPLVYGPPGVLVNGQPATANAGWSSLSYPGRNPFAVSLAAYASTSPWCLLDVAGGTTEWI